MIEKLIVLEDIDPGSGVYVTPTRTAVNLVYLF